jgi:hypothetical protein
MTAWAASIDAIQGETQVTPGQSFQKATVEPVRGELSVNQGQGFQKVNSRIEVKVGDSVMVAPGGLPGSPILMGARLRSNLGPSRRLRHCRRVLRVQMQQI